MQRDSVEDLLATLESEDGAFEVERGKSVRVTVTRYRGGDLDFPTVISTSPEHFLAYLDCTAPGAASLWDCEPREAAYRLLLANIDEEFDCLKGNPDLIQIGPKELYVRRTRPRPRDPLDDLPPGDYEWRA